MTNAAEKPFAENISPIHGMLSGLGVCYVDDIPTALLSRLQDEMKAILRVTEDHSANLLCLGILALLASRLSVSNVMPSELVRQALRPARQFFTAKRAQKTLELVVLKSIYICANGCKLRTEDSLECLRLSAKVIDTVDEVERQLWVANNSSKAKKLHEKILHPDLDHELRLAALDLVTILLGDLSMPKELLPVCQHQLLAIGAFSLSLQTTRKFLCQIDPASINSMMKGLLELACRKGQPDDIHLKELENSLHLVKGKQTSGILLLRPVFEGSPIGFGSAQ